MMHNARKPTSADRKPSGRDRDDPRDRDDDRERRVGAAQLAAPPTRTWRRAGRFASSK